MPRIILPQEMTVASGRPGEAFFTTYLEQESRSDDLKLQDYRRMLDNDGQIQMLWNAITNTILSAGFEIQDDSDTETEEPSEEQQFIERNFTQPIWKGGMSMKIDTINRTMLRALVEGYRLFEVIYRKGEDGKLYLDKLAPRSGKN